MSTQDEVVVWASRLDGKYDVKVIWTAPNAGELSISDDVAVLHREPVTVSSRSELNLEVGEVASWQEIAIRFVDELERR